MAGAADLDLLPPVARELADAIGLDATLALVQRWGGSRFNVPRTPDADLILLLGPRAALELCRVFSGERFDLPRCARQLRAVRDRAILAALQGGESSNHVALHMGLTRRQIFNIKRQAALPDPDPTLDLWGG